MADKKQPISKGGPGKKPKPKPPRPALDNRLPATPKRQPAGSFDKSDVGSPLEEMLPGGDSNDDRDNQQLDPRDFQEEPDGEEGDTEETGEETDSDEKDDSSRGREGRQDKKSDKKGSEKETKPGSPAGPGAPGGGLGQGAGSAEAAGERVAEKAAATAVRAGAAALLSNPWGIAIVIVVLTVLFLVIIFGFIVTSSAGGGGGSSTSTSSESSTGPLDTSASGSAEELLNMKNVTIYPGGRDDLKTGQIDKQVINLLIAIGKQHKIMVTSLKSGHSQYTNSGNVSDHYSGHAVDIFTVDEKPCLNSGNPTRGVSACSTLAADILKAEKKKDPQIIYTSFKSTTPRGRNCIHDADGSVCGDHRDHIHVGYPAR